MRSLASLLLCQDVLPVPCRNPELGVPPATVPARPDASGMNVDIDARSPPPSARPNSTPYGPLNTSFTYYPRGFGVGVPCFRCATLNGYGAPFRGGSVEDGLCGAHVGAERAVSSVRGRE